MTETVRILGILGGMGPYATLKFYEVLLKHTNAKKDWEHIRTILDINPHIPSRSRYLLCGEDSPVKGMIESLQKLENYGVNVICIPCNSACYFLEDIQDHICVPIINIIEVTSNRVKTLLKSNVDKLAVLGGYITYKKEIYKKFLEHECVLIHHSELEQSTISQIIELIKINKLEQANELFMKFIKEYKIRYNPQLLILGCTEFLCLELPKELLGIKVIDSSEELARFVVGYCTKENLEL